MEMFRGPMQPWPGLEKYGRTLTLTGSGMQLFLFDAGAASAPAVVLLHGLADEADTWRHLIPTLAEQNRVLAPDLPGFGRSDHPRGVYSLRFLRDTLIDFLDTLSLNQVLLVGSSLGALLAQLIALEQPGRVQKLALLDGSLAFSGRQPVSPLTLMFLLPGVGRWMYNNLRKDPQAAYETLRPYYFDLNTLPDSDQQFLFQRVNERVWSDGQRRAFLSTLRNTAIETAALQRSLVSRLKGLHTPTLVVWGEKDQINSIENAHATLSLQPNVHLEVIPRAGHLPHQEQPQRVLDLLKTM